MKTILELPPNLDLDQLHTLLNDRIRDINDALHVFVENPATENVDLGTHRIVNLADPANDLDAVNLRTLKRGAPADTGLVPVAAAVSGLDFYAIVFTKDGILDDGESAPSYVVDAGREGKPMRGWFYAKGAPSSDATFNMTVTTASGVSTVFATDATIPALTVLPIFKEPPAFTKRMVKGDRVDLVIKLGGTASSFSAGLIVKRS